MFKDFQLVRYKVNKNGKTYSKLSLESIWVRHKKLRQIINTNGSKLECHTQKEAFEFEVDNKNQDKSSDTEKDYKQVI